QFRSRACDDGRLRKRDAAADQGTVMRPDETPARATNGPFPMSRPDWPGRLVRSRSLWVLTLVVGLTLVPACQVNVNCADVVHQAWWGPSDSVGIQFPGYNGQTINGTMFRPSDSKTYPGRRPVVVVDHGYAEDECHQWWSAEALAGHGYLV